MLLNKELSKSFAIFVRSSYGDLLMVDPLIKYIKQLNTHNKITLFVEDKNAQLIEFMENIDNFYQIPSKGNKYLFFIFFGLKYRKNKYDVSIAAKTGIGSENGFFQYMLGAKKQISYVSKNKTWTDMLVNCPITYSEEIYHSQHYALGVLQLLDNKLTKIPNYLYPKLISRVKPNKNSKPCVTRFPIPYTIVVPNNIPNPINASTKAKSDALPPKCSFTNIGTPIIAGPITNKLLSNVKIIIKRNVALSFRYCNPSLVF